MKTFIQKFRTVGLFFLLTNFVSLPAQAQQSARETNEANAARRQLIICVDGVAFQTIEKMRAEGRFKLFRQPARMIAPFPSLTNLALSEILKPAGAGEAVGYEDNYFDVEHNKMRGGLLDRFRGARFIKGTFRELFDYHPSAVKSGLGYAAPPASTYLESLTDVLRLKQKFRASHEPVFFAYTGASDSLAHLGGERMLKSFLVRLDETVKDIVREGGGRVEVTIFSDHGNDFEGYRRVSLKSALRRANFKLQQKVKDERSVVLPQFGLVGCAVMWTKESNEARLSQVVSRVRGVDFAAYEKDNLVYVLNERGAATIERRGGRFRYRPAQGDPLELLPVAEKLKRQGKSDTENFIADEDWFAATIESARPDVLRRVFEGVSERVNNRANVLVNFADGYYTGSASLDLFAFLQATHGNLGARQSFGFVMSSALDLPPYLRARDVWRAIGSPVLKKRRIKEQESAR
ncbi:MAG TPA: hypothetical protein VGO96_08695 [Pyrinomonadaceae bacterium]|nr:hypothetical protein [Pyrinomonadaceae bacterium]